MIYLFQNFLKTNSMLVMLLQIKKNNKANWVISSYNDINKIILPIFDSFPLNSSKHFNYVLFRTICDMMLKKEHLTEKGFQQIIKIKSQRNFKTSDVSILNNHSINITTPWLIGFREGEWFFFHHTPKAGGCMPHDYLSN